MMATSPAAGTRPLVSVVMPLYNGSEILATAVESVLHQEIRGLEVVLVNDASSDETDAVAQRLARSNPCVRYVSQPVNLGLAPTLNHGIRLAGGEFVLILHQDCRLVGSDWLARALAIAQNSPATVVVGRPFHDTARMEPIEKWFWIIRAHAYDTELTSTTTPRNFLFSENKCDLFRRADLIRLDGFDERVGKGGEDQVLAAKLPLNLIEVVQPPNLWFELSLGARSNVAREMRRDLKFGYEMRRVILRTRFRAIRSNEKGGIDDRLINRLAGVLWPLAVVAAVAAWAVTTFPDVLWIAAGATLVRFFQLEARALRYRVSYHLRTVDVLAIGLVGIVADLAYVAGWLSPKLRSRGSSAPSKPTPAT
jgi:glycosyltransferase involved in cell wall biosynthesis